jgi:hypothetical protein
VGDALYYRCSSCGDALPSAPAQPLHCGCYDMQIEAGGGVTARDPGRVVLLRAIPRETVGKSDLSGLALSMAFLSVGYAIVASLVAVVLVLVAGIAGLKLFDQRPLWPLIALIWVGLEARLILKIWRSAQLSPPVRGASRALHQLEFAVAGFLLLFEFARPYLIDSDASSFPYLRMMFEGFVGIVVFCHCLVLGLFKTKPDRWDVLSLSASVIAIAVAFR